MEAAARRAGRDPASIALVAVSKTHPTERVRAAIEAASSSSARTGSGGAAQDRRAACVQAPWHLIGHLQGNKARQAVGRFALIHSVDSVGLIQELEKRAAAAAVVQPILLQINVSGEASKFGAAPGLLPALLEALRGAPHLAAQGLMTIPPLTDDPKASRPHFRRLRGLLGSISADAPLAPRHLSMGMSDDFEVAIEEGATLIRVGTAIFGRR